MAEIGVILKLESSYNAAQDVIRSLETDEMDIRRVADYQEGIAAARCMVADGAKVLVTRAGYIPHLRGSDLKVPVIEIPFTMGNFTQSCVEASPAMAASGLQAHSTSSTRAGYLTASSATTSNIILPVPRRIISASRSRRGGTA